MSSRLVTKLSVGGRERRAGQKENKEKSLESCLVPKLWVDRRKKKKTRKSKRKSLGESSEEWLHTLSSRLVTKLCLWTSKERTRKSKRKTGMIRKKDARYSVQSTREALG